MRWSIQPARRAHPITPLVLGLLLGGCVPIALPPTHARLSGGVSDDARAVAEWRAGVYPAQLVPAAFTRSWMAGVGYVGRTGGVLSLAHGIYTEIGYVHTRRTGEDSVRRISVSVAPELVHRDDFDAWGRGASLTVGYDLVTAVHGRSGGPSGRFLAAASHGEGAIGAHVTLSGERYADGSLYVGLVGVRLTIPALAGLIFAPELIRGLAN